MTVQVENLGGGGSSFPPRGTQVRDFEDNFHRADATTLGTAWGMAWAMADYPYDAIDRPRPYDAAINPRIKNNHMEWFVRRLIGEDLGRAYSFAFPWQLGWMTQGQFDQYAEVDVAFQFQSSPEPYANIELCTVFSQSAGSLDPDIYLGPPQTGAYGCYSLSIGFDYFVFVYNANGATPSYTPAGGRGIKGIDYAILGPGVVLDQPFPRHFRLETRWTGSSWELTAFVNGENQGVRTDAHLLQGMPSL